MIRVDNLFVPVAKELGPMKSLMRSAWIMLALAAWLAAAEFAAAAPPEVKDDAGFFSVTAVSEANVGIRALKQSFKKDLHVETFLSVPANLSEQFKKDKNKAFLEWGVKPGRQK